MSRRLLLITFLHLLMAGVMSTQLLPSADSGEVNADDDVHSQERRAPSSSAHVGDKPGVFVPTSEWQKIESGQAIPPGLHVRMNLETGVNEAKLMEDTKEESGNGQASRRALQQTSEVDHIPMDDLKHALHKIVDDAGKPDEESVIRQKFRSIDELKRELASLKLTMRTETEIVHNLLDELNQISDSDDERRAKILHDLEFYVHQYDNAVDFVKMGGLFVLTPLLNSTADDVRSSAAFLLGSAMQSNPSVQVSAVDVGLLHRLLNRLAIEPSATVQNKVFYAVACLLRRFPHAQLKFVQLGGLSIVKKFFDDRQDSEEVQRLRLKTITLLYDLVVEHDDVKEDDERRRQYETVGIKQAMVEAEFCSLLSRLLMTVTSIEHDDLEKILKTMKVMAAECRPEFMRHADRLAQLRRQYERLAARDGEAFFGDIRQIVSSLMDGGDVKDEL